MRKKFVTGANVIGALCLLASSAMAETKECQTKACREYRAKLAKRLAEARTTRRTAESPRLKRLQEKNPSPKTPPANGVAWVETGTHKIKIKYKDGVEVGRWEFSKEKPAHADETADGIKAGRPEEETGHVQSSGV